MIQQKKKRTEISPALAIIPCNIFARLYIPYNFLHSPITTFTLLTHKFFFFFSSPHFVSLPSSPDTCRIGEKEVKNTLWKFLYCVCVWSHYHVMWLAAAIMWMLKIQNSALQLPTKKQKQILRRRFRRSISPCEWLCVRVCVCYWNKKRQESVRGLLPPVVFAVKKNSSSTFLIFFFFSCQVFSPFLYRPLFIDL